MVLLEGGKGGRVWPKSSRVIAGTICKSNWVVACWEVCMTNLDGFDCRREDLKNWERRVLGSGAVLYSLCIRYHMASRVIVMTTCRQRVQARTCLGFPIRNPPLPSENREGNKIQGGCMVSEHVFP